MAEDFTADDVEAFGVDEPALEADTEREMLLGMHEELRKQHLTTIDDLERQRLRNAMGEIHNKLTTHPEKEWLELSKRYHNHYNDIKAYPNKLANLGGLSDAAFDELLKHIDDAEAAKSVKPKTTRKVGKKEAAQPAPEVKPDERFAALVLHAKNLGLDAQVIFDELGGGDITDATLARLGDEINRRGSTQAVQVSEGDVESFEVDDSPGTASEAANPPSATSVPVPGVPDASVSQPATTWVIDSAIQGKIDPETGEVVDRDWLLNKLGWTKFPTQEEFTLEHGADVVRVINSYLLPAKKYREQAEKLAAPLEKRAAMVEELFGPLLDSLGPKHLKTVQKKDSKNFGKYTGKTLNLITGAISWEKGGGNFLDQGQMYGWLARKKEEMLALRDQDTPEAQEELAALERKYGLRLKTEVDYNKELLLASKELPFVVECKVNEFEKRTIK